LLIIESNLEHWVGIEHMKEFMEYGLSEFLVLLVSLSKIATDILSIWSTPLFEIRIGVVGRQRCSYLGFWWHFCFFANIKWPL